MKLPRKTSPHYYAQLKKIVSKVHKFGFTKPRRGYTPQQKAAITRMYNRYADELKKIEKGYAKLIPASRYKAKHFPNTKHTNKGFFFYGEKSSEAVRTKSVQSAKLVTQGKTRNLPNDYIAYILGKMIEVLIPIPDHLNDVDAREYVDDLISEYSPIYISLQIRSYHSKQSYTQGEWLKYQWEILEAHNRENEPVKAGERLITGVFFTFPRTRKNLRRWM